MILRKKIILFTNMLLCIHTLQAQNRIITLGDSTGTHLSIDIMSSSFVNFKLSPTTVNPFSWHVSIESMPENNRNGAPFQGHFLCLGRWGAPTDGEIKAGVPHNGEAGNKRWEITSLINDSLLTLYSNSPLDGITAKRKIEFDKYNAVFKVTDHVQSTLSVGRLFNIVQHATIGPPFLTGSTIINSNAGPGFMQHLSYPNPHKYEYIWPNANIDALGTQIDLTTSSTTKSYVSTHLFEEKIGWITAATPDKETLIGYIWSTKDYPWLNLWHEIKDGKPQAKGLEFGTTGIGLSYQDLLAYDTRFHGENSFFYLDALEEFFKSFICFQIKIPNGFRGTQKLQMNNNQIIIYEKGTHHAITINNNFNLE